MKLTNKEKQIILDLRAKDPLEKEADTVNSIDTNLLKDIKDGMFGWILSKSEVNNLVKSIFKKEIPKDSEFYCYIENGKESWYDSIYGIENMSDVWARKYLKSFKKVKK